MMKREEDIQDMTGAETTDRSAGTGMTGMSKEDKTALLFPEFHRSKSQGSANEWLYRQCRVNFLLMVKERMDVFFHIMSNKL
jgi:hypothetical protein